MKSDKVDNIDLGAGPPTETTPDLDIKQGSLKVIGSSQTGTKNTGGKIKLGSLSDAYTNGYLYARKITFQDAQIPGTGSYTNIPIAFYGYYPYLATTANGGNVTNANGYDIIFTSDSLGNNKLDFEIDQYSATGDVIFWIEVPALAAEATTDIYIFYGNSDVSATQATTTGVWDDNYRAVYHFAETSGNYNDSTKYAEHCTTVTVTSRTGVGKLGNAPDFESGAATNRLTCGQIVMYNDHTQELWANRESGGAIRTISQHAAANEDEAGNILFSFETDASNNLWEQWEEGAGANVTLTSTAGAGTGSLQALAVVKNTAATDAYWYINGAATGGTTDYGATNEPTGGTVGSALYIGGRITSAQWFDGIIDEYRVSDIQRSANWLATQYNNVFATSTFYIIGNVL